MCSSLENLCEKKEKCIKKHQKIEMRVMRNVNCKQSLLLFPDLNQPEMDWYHIVNHLRGIDELLGEARATTRPTSACRHFSSASRRS